MWRLGQAIKTAVARDMKSKYYLKILIMISLLAIVYSIAFCSFFYINETREHSERQEKYYNSIIQLISADCDNKISTGINLMHVMSGNKTVRMYTEDEDSYYNITLMAREISENMGGFANAGVNIAVYDTERKKVFGTAAAMDSSAFFESLGYSEKAIRHISDTLSFGGINKVQAFMSDCDKDNYLVIGMSEVINRKCMAFLVYYNLSDFTAQPLLLSKEKIYLMFNEQMYNQNSVYNKLGSFDASEISAESFMRNKEQILLSAQSRHINIRYILYSDSDENISYINVLNRSLILIFIVLAAIGGIIAYLISKRMYKPIEKLTKMFDGNSTENSEDEIEFLRHSILRIRNENKRLFENMDNYTGLLKAKSLRELMQNTGERKNIDISLFSHVSDAPVVILVEFSYSGQNDLEFMTFRQIIANVELEMNTLFSEVCSIHYEIVSLNLEKCAIVINSKDIKTVKEKMVKMGNILNSDFNIAMCVCIGKRVDSIENINESYLSAKEIMDGRFGIGKKIVYTDDDISEYTTYYFPSYLENELVNATFKGKNAEVMQILDELFAKNFNGISGNEHRLQFIISLAMTANRIGKYCEEFSRNEFETGEILENLKACKTAEDLHRVTDRIFANLLEHFERKQRSMDEAMSKQLMEFIEENYNKDISLLDIAVRFNITVGYASSMFKNYVGENFKEYLNTFRMEQAKKIMEQNEDIKIQDLSEMVGLNNVNTFLRIFKKHYGISPGQYKEKVKKDKNDSQKG